MTVLASLIESRKITSTDLTNMYLARLKRYGDQLHCVVTLTEDLALAQAAAADKEIKAGRYRGPLHGIPFGVKDLFDTKGIRTTWGAKPYENRVAEVDATIVERLRDAGAVLCAKLSMGALAQGGVWFGGSTRNPWSPDNSSSGSSAGPGAATSAGLVAFAIGTETRGSIISPSSTCGVVGLRPTYGRVSRYGAMALSWTMDKIGPMCRSVEDCAIVFNAIYGSDGRDETVVDAPFAWNPDVPLSSLKIGFIESEFNSTNVGGGGGGRGGGNPEDARRRAEERNKLLKEALDVLRTAGAKLEPMALPEFPANALGFILSAEAAAAFDDLTRSKEVDLLTEQGAGRVAEHLPHVALHPGGRVHPRAARAHAAQPADGRADVEVRRVPVADRQREPRHHQPDRPSRRVPEGRLRRRLAAGADDHRAPLRRSQRAARRARLRAGDEVAHDEPAARRESEEDETDGGG